MFPSGVWCFLAKGVCGGGGVGGGAGAAEEMVMPSRRALLPKAAVGSLIFTLGPTDKAGTKDARVYRCCGD